MYMTLVQPVVRCIAMYIDMFFIGAVYWHMQWCQILKFLFTNTKAIMLSCYAKLVGRTTMLFLQRGHMQLEWNVHSALG